MKKKIDINKLVVNPKNYRFDPVENQGQAINLMLEEKGPEILNLASHIAEHGLDEAKAFRVLEIKKDLFLVLDGNRRSTAIKCLLEPSLTKSESLKNKFIKISKEIKNIPKEINCVIYKTEEEAAKWIKLDHTGKNKGMGLDSWGMAEQERFSYRFEGKISPTMKVINLFEHETKSKVDTEKVKISTIERILSNPESRAYIGLDFVNGEIILTAPKKEVIERLDKLFNKIIIDDVPVQEVYDTGKKVKFMKNLLGEQPKISKEPTIVSSKGVVKKSKAKNIRSLPKSGSRSTLIPSNFNIKIHQQKINNIFHELKSIPLEEYTNAPAVLFRVFLETSIDYYAEKHGMSFESKIKLKGKITKITEDLEKREIATSNQLKNIKHVATKRNSILSIENFHEYVHSFKNQPLPVDLIYAWDNLQEFFEILWKENAKKNKEKKK